MTTHANTTDLEQRLARMEARQAIVDLLTDYTILVDQYDIDGVAALFTPDCVTDYGPGRGGLVLGRDQVRARIARGQAEFRRTHHHHGQMKITLLDDHRAEALSYLSAWHERWDGSRDRVYLRYLDRLVVHEGTWLIAERKVVVSGVEGFDGVEWVWVERALPPDRTP
jgi:3-phenylpropionate/cinnamic acid dioxygenase small subunit